MNNLLIVSWDEIYDICLELADKIIKDSLRIDAIIGVSRGGIIPARIFADIFDIKDLYIIYARYYKGIEDRLDKPIIDINLDISRLKDKSIIVVDDIADTGSTIAMIMNELRIDAKTLTLFKKPRSRFTPDYYARLTDRWVVFPWERFEVIRSMEDASRLKMDEQLLDRLISMKVRLDEAR